MARAKPKTAERNAPKKKKYNFVIMCHNTEDPSITRIDGVVGPSFVCPRCGDRLVYLPAEHKLGGQAKSAKTIKHELRRVQEVQEVA